MGVYLHIGFVAKATADLPENSSKEAVNQALAAFYPPEMFHCKVLKGKIYWTLKSEIIQTELPSFVETFYKDFYGKNRNLDTMDSIRKIAAAPDWFQQMRKTDDYSFQVYEDTFDDSFMIGGQKRIYLNTTIVWLGSEGKFLMEQSRCTLRFLENCARRAYSHFKLGKTIRIHVF